MWWGQNQVHELVRLLIILKKEAIEVGGMKIAYSKPQIYLEETLEKHGVNCEKWFDAGYTPCTLLERQIG